jgi:hypothetical protein
MAATARENTAGCDDSKDDGKDGTGNRKNLLTRSVLDAELRKFQQGEARRH